MRIGPIATPQRLLPVIAFDMLLTSVIAVLMLAGLVWLGSNGLAKVVGHAEQIANFNMEASVRISRVATQVQAMDALLYRTMTLRAANGDPAQSEADIDQLSVQVDEVIAEMKAYRDTYALPRQRPAIDAAIVELENYRGAVKWVGSMLEIDFNSAVSFIRPFNALFEHMNQLIGEMTADLQQDAREQASAAARQAKLTGRWFLLLTANISGCAVLAAWATGRNQLKLRVNGELLEQEVALRTSELTYTTDALRSAKEQAEKALREMREAQRQLIESEKMAALGSLVAGIAHEVNTPIGSALTAASALEEKSTSFRTLFNAGTMKRSDLARYVESSGEATMLILANIRRAAELIQSFKQVAADQTSAVCRRFSLHACLDELLLSLRPRLKKTHITVQVECPPDLAIVSYPGALSQIMTNLIMNSLMHAYDEGAVGVITISASATDEGRLTLRYEDDGRGIPAAILPKIFDPFFTTKRGAGGTGLGLHIVYNNVVQKLGGTIAVSSSEGKGTSFVLDLPCEVPAEPAATVH